ncbi:MAG: DUF3090 family protein [Chloroflexaceae bacterium]|nr:DUF3090 family protein [Chloroflexaceae bacterium]
MADFTYNLDPVDHITVGTVGPPGQRVFYMQARRDRQLLTLLAEKEQIRALSEAIDHLLEELTEKNPLLSTTDDMLITNMSLEEPIEPMFRVAQMGLGYDNDRDMIVLVVQGASGEEEGDTILARFSANRSQIRTLGLHAQKVVASGRPVCRGCGRPVNPEGNFCPERNGHGPCWGKFDP